jgi:hypothetical protein
MSTRHERRRAAKRRQERKLEGLAQAAIAARTAAIVKRNMSAPPERNYYAGIASSVVHCMNAGARKGGGFGARTERREHTCKRWGA